MNILLYAVDCHTWNSLIHLTYRASILAAINLVASCFIPLTLKPWFSYDHFPKKYTYQNPSKSSYASATTYVKCIPRSKLELPEVFEGKSYLYETKKHNWWEWRWFQPLPRRHAFSRLKEKQGLLSWKKDFQIYFGKHTQMRNSHSQMSIYLGVRYTSLNIHPMNSFKGFTPRIFLNPHCRIQLQRPTSFDDSYIH